MLYWLTKWLQSTLSRDAWDSVSFLRVFEYVTFRGMMAMVLSFLTCLLLGSRTINWLRRKKIGDAAKFDQADIDKMLAGKEGTPTMGGLLIVGAIAAATLLLGDLANFYVRAALVCLLWLAVVGAADDWLKLTSKSRKASQGGTGGPPVAGEAGTLSPSPNTPGESRGEGLLPLPLAGEGWGEGGQGERRGTGAPPVLTAPTPAPTPAPTLDPKLKQVSESRRQGLYSWEKLIFQVGLGILLAWFTYAYGINRPPTHTLYFPFLKGTAIVLGGVWFVVIAMLVLVGTSNAVNLTDGLDGLASGCSAIVAFTMFILAMIIGHQPLAAYLNIEHIREAGEMAVLAGAITGACLGFLWYNCHPAKVFMGDTGSLSLGGLIAYIAIVIRQELLLIILGGIFVAEAMSVLIQVSYYKYSRRKYGEGRRIFRMSPLHLHFLKGGWSETTTVVRFWLIQAMLAALTLATIKLR